MTDEEMRDYAARHGHTLRPEDVGRMRMLAEKAAQTGSSIPRMPQKWDEPAAVLTLPLPPR